MAEIPSKSQNKINNELNRLTTHRHPERRLQTLPDDHTSRPVPVNNQRTLYSPSVVHSHLLILEEKDLYS